MALQTSMLTLPGTYVGIVRDSAYDAGILGRLSAEKPTLFGPVSGATFSGRPKVSIVGESEAKPAGDDPTITPWSAEPVKGIVQIRTSDEFKWADDDYRMGILRDLVAPGFGEAIGRFADLFVFHGINPKTGEVSAKATKYLAQTTSTVTAAGSPTGELNAAVAAVVGAGATPSGIAADSGFVFQLGTEVFPEGHSRAGEERYPSMSFDGPTNWRGLNVEKSTTVSGVEELAADSGIRAFMGPWGTVRWGFQKQFPLEVIEYGDPDNTGRDLKGSNEVLIRSEAVIYAAIADVNKFAKIQETVSP